MDQTTLAASLYIIGNALGSTDQVSWIASGYFMYVFIPLLITAKKDIFLSPNQVML